MIKPWIKIRLSDFSFWIMVIAIAEIGELIVLILR